MAGHFRILPESPYAVLIPSSPIGDVDPSEVALGCKAPPYVASDPQ